MPNASRSARPLTARSVVASLLLGVTPPRLPSRHLVRAGALFGIEEGTVRVALSRMVSAGELVRRDGDYELAGHLLERQARQAQGRVPPTTPWSGDWRMVAVQTGARRPVDRAALRRAARALRLGELREGLWLRPDNLPRQGAPEAEAVIGSQCHRFTVRPDDEAGVVAALWDLDRWSSEAGSLRRQMSPLATRLERADTDALAPAFLLAAAVVRHLADDPLLPTELLPATWPAPALRAEYDRYEAAFKTLWRTTLSPTGVRIRRPGDGF